MSQVAISGNASGTGTLTIAAPNTNSNYTLTLPTNTGTIVTNKTAGTVLQVVQGTLTTTTSTSSTSFVTTNLSASITPSSATSKILAIVSMADCLIDTASKNGCATLYRGATNLSPAGSAVTNGMAALRSESGGIQANINFSYLDSPSTTSSTTYTVYFAILATAATFNINNIGTASTIILMEIAA